MPSELIKKLLESGVHFGHQKKRWNPKMRPFIFGERSGIYIIDLEKTEECLNQARDFLMSIAAKGEMVLLVGTKKQAQEVIKEESLRCGMFYVTERWPGGLLTNFSTVKKSINRLKDIERMREDGTFEKLTKKEVARLEKERAKLMKNFSGIVKMERMPKAVIVVDTKKEETAVREACRLKIPVIGLIDTNSNPDPVSYPVPGNDDATKSIRMVISLLSDAIIEGRRQFLSYLSQEGVAIGAQAEGQEKAADPAEETKIKEIEEIVDKSETGDKDDKGAKRPHPQDEDSKARQLEREKKEQERQEARAREEKLKARKKTP